MVHGGWGTNQHERLALHTNSMLPLAIQFLGVKRREKIVVLRSSWTLIQARLLRT